MRGFQTLAHSTGEPGDTDSRQERKDKDAANNQIFPIGRKDEDEAAAFNEGGKGGDAERHQKEAEYLPAVEFGGGVCSGGAEDECDADDGAEAEGREPQARIGIGVAYAGDDARDEVTPEGLSGTVECGRVGKERLHGGADIKK